MYWLGGCMYWLGGCTCILNEYTHTECVLRMYWLGTEYVLLG